MVTNPLSVFMPCGLSQTVEKAGSVVVFVAMKPLSRPDVTVPSWTTTSEPLASWVTSVVVKATTLCLPSFQGYVSECGGGGALVRQQAVSLNRPSSGPPRSSACGVFANGHNR